MKRALLVAVLFCSASALSGCPIYNHEDEGCYRDNDCAPGYACDGESGDCYPLPSSDHSFCGRPSDCAEGETCASSAQCVPGDCSFSGCVRGYVCDSSSGIWSCVRPDSGAGGAPGAGIAGAAGTAAAGESSTAAGQSGG